ALQFLADGPAVEVGAAQAVFFGEDAGEDTGGHHGRGETRAFLVGPDRDFQRCVRLEIVVVERADYLQAGQHAIDAIELAPPWAGYRDGRRLPPAADCYSGPAGGRKYCPCGRC